MIAEFCISTVLFIAVFLITTVIDEIRAIEKELE